MTNIEKIRNASVREALHDPGAEFVAKTIHDMGGEALFVGGCVRDALMGERPHDIDIATSLRPEKVVGIFRERGLAVVPKGIAFGTVSVFVDGKEFEVTTFRKDGRYEDGRRPSRVAHAASFEEDAARRDFTINAVGFCPMDGKIIDPFGGAGDIKRGIIRCVGDPSERFAEDGLRVLRAVRFAARYKFALDTGTADALRSRVGMLSKVSKERITEEFRKMLFHQCEVKDVFLAFPEAAVACVPGLAPCIGFNQNNKYHPHELWEHMLSVADGVDEAFVPGGKLFAVRLAAMLHDNGKPSVVDKSDGDGRWHFNGHPEAGFEILKKSLGEDFRLTSAEREDVLSLVRFHDMQLAPREKPVRRALAKHGEEFLRMWAPLRSADMRDHVGLGRNPFSVDAEREILPIVDDIARKNLALKVTDLAIGGREVMEAAGWTRLSKKVGEALSALFQEVMDERVNS